MDTHMATYLTEMGQGFHGEVFKIKPPAELPRANVTIPEGEVGSS